MDLLRVIKERVTDHLINGIQYEKIDEWYEISQLETELESWEQYLVPADTPSTTRSSSIPKSRSVSWKLEARDDVRMYLKLPAWFKVPTPVGEYNPDWAVVMEQRDPYGEPTGEPPLLYLVRETKDSTWKTSHRPSERRKILCGAQHFEGALAVDYKVVSSASELQ